MHVCVRLCLQACSQEVRRRTPGIFPGYWFDFFPSTLEWHWAAGLNMFDCSPAVVPGDWNGPFTRLRLLTALRMLEEAARHGAADTELVLCANEVLTLTLPLTLPLPLTLTRTRTRTRTLTLARSCPTRATGACRASSPSGGRRATRRG